jgi:mono/diheme cytochrome c family protein
MMRDAGNNPIVLIEANCRSLHSALRAPVGMTNVENLRACRRRSARFLASVAVLLCALVAAAEADHSWLKRVPEKDRQRVNPYAGKTDAVAAGTKLYGEHCSKCHGADLEGGGNKPALRSETVRNATDGELFWILRNGDLRHGMPSWSSLPEPDRWEVIAFLRSSQEPAKAP